MRTGVVNLKWYKKKCTKSVNVHVTADLVQFLVDRVALLLSPVMLKRVV